MPDAIIAATAIITDEEFITKNQRDYRFIRELHLIPYPLQCRMSEGKGLIPNLF
jgi:predicted nucleic acid-binding protein